MKLSEGATIAAVARDVACGMRSSLLFLHSAHYFFFLPIFYFFFLSRFRRKSLCTSAAAFYVTMYEYPLCSTVLPMYPSLRCVHRASSKSPTIIRDSTEMENVRISDFQGFLLSLLLGFIWFSTEVYHSFLFRFFSNVCSLRELFNHLFPIFVFTFYFIFFFFGIPSHESKEAYHRGKQLSSIAVSTWQSFLFFF